MEQTVQRSKTFMMALCGLFAAVTAICSWISIPLGFTPVPVNLGTLAVFLTGGLLGKKYGPISLIVYTLAGAVGLPVFSGFRGGLSVLAGPTGGYIIGYIVAALIIGLIISGMTRRERTTGAAISIYAFAMICGLAACYALGTAWFMISTHTPFAAAMVSCVIPFLPGDALKIIAATILVRKLKKYI
ncbi:MAG: biotin transporter BioY [Firmicutes bacterium]|nr:biotin transporter BioY [Bacillota bacterium]